MTIDIDRLNYLIKQADKSAEKILNHKGIILVGLTGAGKSTTALSLLGH